MNNTVNIDEMRGMFLALSCPSFGCVFNVSGYLLVLEGNALLTARGNLRYFKTIDSLVAFVERHFVVPHLKRGCVNISIDPQFSLI